MEHQLAAGAAGTARLPGSVAQYRSTPHPSTMQMVIEALQAKDSRKGASAAAIKKFILAKYPTVDPSRLKYWLRVTLNKGLSRGDLVRPQNSTATGAVGTFKLAPRMLKQKQTPVPADPDGGEPSKPAQPAAPRPGRAPAAGVRQRGKGPPEPRALGVPGPQEGLPQGSSSARPAGQKVAAVKQKSQARPVEAPAPAAAAAKPRSDGAKRPRAVGRLRDPGEGHSEPSMAPAAEEEGGDSGDGPAGAGAKRPVAKSKRKAPKEPQEGAPKVKGGEGKVRKPRGKAGAGQA